MLIIESMEIYKTKKKLKTNLPYFDNFVPAGFPSPAADYGNQKLDLNEYLIPNPASTFLVRVEGESMIGAGIFPGDMLIVDRSKEVKDGLVVLAVINNEFTIKRYKKEGRKIFLIPENSEYTKIEVNEGMDFEVWGVVTNVIHKP